MLWATLISLYLLPLTVTDNESVLFLDNCIDHLRRVTTNSPQPSNALLLHGTSTHTIKHIASTGYIPSSKTPDPLIGNFIYFYPNGESEMSWDRSFYFSGDLRTEKVRFKEGVKAIKSYAQSIAWRHAFIKYLNLELSVSQLDNLIADFYASYDFSSSRLLSYTLDEELYSLLLAKGITDDQIREAVRYANEYRGILMTLSPSVLEEHTILPAYGSDEGIRIYAPKGIHYRHISDIYPFSLSDRFELDTILKQNPSAVTRPD